MPQLSLPSKRTNDLLIQSVGDETLVYDERLHQAFCLNRVAASIWRHADGTRSVEQIAAASSTHLNQHVDDDAVLLALSQLEKDGLLNEAPTLTNENGSALSVTLSRRAMMTRTGAGAAMMLPVIAAIMAPKAAQAYSGCFNCTTSQQRQAKKVRDRDIERESEHDEEPER